MCGSPQGCERFSAGTGRLRPPLSRCRPLSPPTRIPEPSELQPTGCCGSSSTRNPISTWPCWESLAAGEPISGLRSPRLPRSCARIATDSHVAEPYGRSSHGRIFYGWYIRSQATKKAIWFGFLPRAWARHGLSPLWTEVKVSTSWSRQRLLEALSGLHGQGQAGLFEDGAETFLIPLAIPAFAGKDEAVDSLRSQLESVICRLDGVVSEGEYITPDQPDIDKTNDETPESV